MWVFAVCWLLVIGCRLLCVDVCCVSCVVNCWLLAGSSVAVRCSLFVVCYSLLVVCCLLFAD